MSFFKRHERKSAVIFCALFIGIFAVLACCDIAFADSGAGLPWEDAIGKIKTSITGPVALAVSLIAIVAAGVALVFGGDMQGFMRTAAYVALVIGLIVAAQNVLDKLYTSSAYIPFSF
jgi:type IV secretion system protein VirB2